MKYRKVIIVNGSRKIITFSPGQQYDNMKRPLQDVSKPNGMAAVFWA